MNLFIFIGVIVASAYLNSSNAQSPVTLHSYINDNDGSGNYYFKYNCSDGQVREERGELQDGGGEVGEDGSKAWIKVTGFYSFIGTDGKSYKVTYQADKGGYRPKVTISGEASEEHAVGSLSSNSESSFGFDPATGSSSGSSSGSSLTGVNVQTQNSATSSSVSAMGAVSSSSSSSSSEDETYQYNKPADVNFDTQINVDSNAVSQENTGREYIPPRVPSNMYVPAPSIINSIMGNVELPFAYARRMGNGGDNEIGQNLLF